MAANKNKNQNKKNFASRPTTKWYSYRINETTYVYSFCRINGEECNPVDSKRHANRRGVNPEEEITGYCDVIFEDDKEYRELIFNDGDTEYLISDYDDDDTEYHVVVSDDNGTEDWDMVLDDDEQGFCEFVTDKECLERFKVRRLRMGGKDYRNHIIEISSDDQKGLEILDYLQATDNGVAQDEEDNRKNAYNSNDDNGNFVETGFNLISGTHIDKPAKGKGISGINVSAGYRVCSDYLGPEQAIFGEEHVSQAEILFEKYVFPKLSEKEKNLFFDYYGARKTACEIAAVTFKKNSKPVTEAAITKRIRQLKEKVKDLLSPHI